MNTGDDCIKNLNVLKTVEFQEVEKTLRGNTVFVRTRPTVTPNGLASSIASNFYIFSPSNPNVNPIINQWVEGTDIYVAITHSPSVQTYTAYLIPNTLILS